MGIIHINPRGLNQRMRSTDVDTLKALAIHEGIRLVIENNQEYFEIESDSLTAINNIRGELRNLRFATIYANTIYG